MKKTIIIPYFGKFPDYFDLFLRSCKYNFNYNWIIFTDNHDRYNYPKNVKIVNMDFEELKKIIQKKFDFKISLDFPYKLCDFKPAYGYIFSEWIKDSEWWGYSDCDLIYGNLEKMIESSLFKNYDKIFTTGHLSFFKNTEKINKCFMNKYCNINYFHRVFTSKKIYAFDENVINELFLLNGFKIYTGDLAANPSVYYYHFRLIKRDYDIKRYLTEDYTPSLYLWDKGNMCRYYYSEDDGRLTKNEFAYMHFQQRKMILKKNNGNFAIIKPNSIDILNKKSFNNLADIWHYKNGQLDLNLLKITFLNRIRYRIKRNLSFIFHGKFTRSNF
ncbi:hypothetical protein CP369_07950 [Lactobacillus sp. UMNPBX18]|nr:hypothetical protein CP369_07950 [Lactobacillus sp. UMNPBX18]